MYIRVLVSALMLPLLVFVVAKSIQLDDLRTVLFTFPYQSLLLLCTLSFSIVLLKVWRFLILLRNSNIVISFFETLRAFVASQTVTPLPGGETFRGLLIHKESGTSMIKISSSVITQAYVELFGAALLTLLGSFLFHVYQIPAFISLALLVFIAVLLVGRRFSRFLFQKLPQHDLVVSFYDKLQKIQKGVRFHFYDESSGLPDKILVRTTLLTIFAHLVGGFLVFLIAREFHINLSIFQSIFVYSASILIQGFASISPGGLGFTEGGMVGILLLFGVEATAAIGIVVIFRVVTLLFYILLGLPFFGIFYGRSVLFNK